MLSEQDCAEIAAAALPAYGFDAASSEVRLLSLSENGTYRVRGPAGELVLRVHRPGYQTPGSIASELTWMDALRDDCGVVTPAVVPAVDGRRVVTLERPDGPRHVVAFELVPGVTAEESAHLLPVGELGRLTARMHLHTQRWSVPDGFERFHWDLDACLGDSARWGAWSAGPGLSDPDRPVVARAADEVRARLTVYGQGPDRYGLIHADLRLANLMVDDDRRLTVIDFDDCGFGWFLYDLATVLSWLEHEPGSPATVAAWLEGYTAERELSEVDLAMVPTFVMLRRLMLTAWLGTHPASPPALELGTTFGAGTGDLARRYLDDADWFRVPARPTPEKE